MSHLVKNKNGQASIGEIILIVVLLGVIIAGGWYVLSKTTQANRFADQARQYQYTESHGGIRFFDFSCVPRSIMDKWGGDGNKSIVNVVYTDKQ